MSDAAITAITTVAACVVTVTTLVVGFLTLWLKMRYGAEKAEEAAAKAKVVEAKLDANTLTTNSVDGKADTIVSQTNGAMDRIRELVARTADRVEKLEQYNHESVHRMLDVVHALGLKVERLLVVQELQQQAPRDEANQQAKS